MRSGSGASAAAFWVWAAVWVPTAGAGIRNQPPVARPRPPPPNQTTPAQRPPAPPEPVAEPPIVPPEPAREDTIAAASLDDLNRNSPLKPVFFEFNSAEVDSTGQAALDANAAILKKYSAWTVTIEGHCDDRGTAE